MVQSLADAERDRLRRRWDALVQRIESLPDGIERDALLDEQDQIEHAFGEIWFPRDSMCVCPATYEVQK